MSDAHTIRFSLPASITIENVEAVTGEIKQLGCEPKSTLTLDASALNVITTPGIQLLLSLHQTVTQSVGKLLVQNVGDALIHSFLLLGLQSQLAVWSEQHA